MIRIGHNINTNMLPLFYFLPKKHPLYELFVAEPAGHNKMLEQGQIDMAPVSSFAYAQHWQEYAILPNLSVTNYGWVGSILLFSKVPLEELDHKTVALTNQSATSINLLKIILFHYLGIEAAFLTMPPDLSEMMARADAALLIGDSAIKANATNHGYLVFDLGHEWRRLTGYPMTFSVWAYTRRLIEECPAELLAVYQILLRAKQQALENFSCIIEASKQLVGLDDAFWQDYFSRFNYDLSPLAIEG